MLKQPTVEMVEGKEMAPASAMPAQSVRRVADILFAFTAAEQALGVSEIARRLDLAKSVVHRTLTALAESGLVSREHDGARYRLGPRAVELGMAALGAPDIRTLALPVMQELVGETRESSAASVLAGKERLYVAQVEGPQDIRMSVEIGRRFPLYAGASGKAILASLPEAEIARYLELHKLEPLTKRTVRDKGALSEELEAARQRGYAASRGERDTWAAAVAAPLFNSHRVVGAISICGPESRVSEALVPRYGELVVAAAARLSQSLR